MNTRSHLSILGPIFITNVPWDPPELIGSKVRVAIQLAKIWLEFWLEKRLEIPF